MKKTKSLAETFKKLAPGRRPLAVAVMTLLAASSASALDWSNAQIQSGTLIGGTETTADGSKVTTIFQSSGKGIIDWAGAGNTADAGFNLAANEALNLFNGTSGTTLMRDVTGQASKILGAVNATGSIWVVNKAGVFIGSSAAVDVGKQFLAAAGDISDTDFLNGTFNFTDVSGEVWNVGTIKAGDDVILVGAKVVNQGRIQAADQLAVGGFKIGDAGTLAMNVGGGKITFTVTGDATAGAVVNEGVLENAAYAAQDMAPTADITGLTGKFNATTDLTDGTYTTADGKVHYTQGSETKTLTPAALGTADASLGTYTAVRIQAQETITSLKDKGQVNAAILAMEAAAVKQSDTAETAPVAGLGTGTAGDGTLTAAKDAALKATGGELAIGDLSAGQDIAVTAVNGITAGDLTATNGGITLENTSSGEIRTQALTARNGTLTVKNGDKVVVQDAMDVKALGADTTFTELQAKSAVKVADGINFGILGADYDFQGTVTTGAGKSVAFVNANDIKVSDITAGTEGNRGDVILHSTSGDIKATGTLTGENVAVTASGAGAGVTVNEIAAAAVATVKGATVTTAGDVAAGNSASILASTGDASVNGAVTADDGAVTIMAVGDAMVRGSVSAGTDAAIKGSTVSVAAVTAAAGDVTIGATNGNAALTGTIAATGEVGITAAGSVTLEGTVKARQVEVTTLGGDILAGSSSGTVLLEASQATLTAAGKIGTEANPILTKVGELSAAAGYDASASEPIPTAQSGICLVQTEGDWIITDLRDFGTGDVTLVAAGDATLGHVVSESGSVTVRAGGEILDGNGAGADITARKAILAAGRGAGISDALEISLSGTEGVLLWGAGVDGGSGGCVLMNVSTVGGNPNPAAGAAPGSNVIWVINGRYAGGDARLIASAQTAGSAVFDDLPLTIRTNEVFAPFLFLSLDLGVLPPAGQGYIDYPRPVRRLTEPEEPADDRGARSGQ